MALGGPYFVPEGSVYTQFKGQSRVIVDQKGRISIPVKFRNLLVLESRDALVLLKGLEKCIYAYPVDEWERLTEIFESMSRNIKEKYRFNRRWALYATPVQFDPQGRIQLPQNLREYAAIQNDAIVGGVVDHIEIWNPNDLEGNVDEGEADFEDMFGNVIVSQRGQGNLTNDTDVSDEPKQ
jgi:MraZ protein